MTPSSLEIEHPAFTDYKWINPAEAANIRQQRLVLFGAGQGTEEFLNLSGKVLAGNEIAFITDNDASFWGKRLHGYEIRPPHHLKESTFDRIVVTSVSEREAISIQLRSMGYQEGRDFSLIGRYPKAYLKNFEILSQNLPASFSLKDKRVLHVGPGGFLGLEILLYCLGAERTCSIDKFGFGIHYPDITDCQEEYLEIRETIDTSDKFDEKRHPQALHRFETLFERNKNRTLLATDKIAYHYPMDVCDLDFPDQSFDVVFSSAVLEHINEPPAAVKEMARVLKKGGLMLNTVVTRDHRSFSKIKGYHPFSFRTYSADKWEEICSNKFYQNRLLPIEWKRLFETCGLTLLKYSVETVLEIDERMFETFHPDFRRFSREALGEIDCMILAIK